MSEMFGIRAIKPYQTKAMVKFLQEKIDVFGSPIYKALPFVVDTICEAAVHVVVVVSPLVNRIKDQIDKQENLGILVASLSDISEENVRGVRARKCLNKTCKG